MAEPVGAQLDCQGDGGAVQCKEQRPLHERAREYESNPDLIHAIIMEGADQARDAARDTLEEVRAAMGVVYR